MRAHRLPWRVGHIRYTAPLDTRDHLYSAVYPAPRRDCLSCRDSGTNQGAYDTTVDVVEDPPTDSWQHCPGWHDQCDTCMRPPLFLLPRDLPTVVDGFVKIMRKRGFFRGTPGRHRA